MGACVCNEQVDKSKEIDTEGSPRKIENQDNKFDKAIIESERNEAVHRMKSEIAHQSSH